MQNEYRKKPNKNNRMEIKVIKCSNTQTLENFVTATYPTVTIIQHTKEQRKFTFTCGLIMNIYTTGTVNFQGNSGNSTTMLGIMSVINTINGAA